MFNLSSTWFRQPTTLIGLTGIGASIAALVFGKIDATTAGIVLTSSLALAGIDDNTGAQDIKALAADAAAAATADHLSERIPGLITDAVRAANDLAKKAAVPAILMALSLSAAGCGKITPDQKAAILADGKVLACQIDMAIQPLGAQALATLVPQAGLAVTADQLAIHPAVVAWCNQQGGTLKALPSGAAASSAAPSVPPVIAPDVVPAKV